MWTVCKNRGMTPEPTNVLSQVSLAKAKRPALMASCILIEYNQLFGVQPFSRSTKLATPHEGRTENKAPI